MALKKDKNRQQPSRYDLHRSMANPTYTTAAEPIQQKVKRNNTEDIDKKRGFPFKRLLLILIILILSPFLVIGIWDYQNAADASEKMFGTRNVASALFSTGLNKSTNGRTNIMMVGYSADDPDHAGALLTDSIMVISLDKEQKSGFMLSVPRDLLVDIPDYGTAKINEAFQAGENENFRETGYPNGGVGLLQKVVSENFDIPIHYHVIVNYGAVRDIVNALDGVTVTINSPDPRGLYDPNFKPQEGGPLKLENGPQNVDGQTALRLTRARGSTFGSYGFPQSDFNRTQNQQAVFSAIKSEIDWRLILDPRLNEKFFNAVTNNTKTDLRISEVIPMLTLVQAVPSQSLRSISLRDIDGTNYLASYTTRQGQSALIPAAGIDDFSEIQAVVKQLSQ
jgi:polyisoprenyl-teichoic acid--peptidoglycan teichoic acid transferase